MSSNEANDCCMGYFILAAKNYGLDEQEIREILYCFNSAFDEHTTDEAVAVYKNFDF